MGEKQSKIFSFEKCFHVFYRDLNIQSELFFPFVTEEKTILGRKISNKEDFRGVISFPLKKRNDCEIFYY